MFMSGAWHKTGFRQTRRRRLIALVMHLIHRPTNRSMTNGLIILKIPTLTVMLRVYARTFSMKGVHPLASFIALRRVMRLRMDGLKSGVFAAAQSIFEGWHGRR